MGWGTNILAIQMTFYPIEFMGPKLWQPEGQPFGLFGWQGIIPAKAGKMADIMVTLMMEKLFDVAEVFAKLDPEEIYHCCRPGIANLVKSVTREAAMAVVPEFWLAAPQDVRQLIYEGSESFSREYILGVLDRIVAEIYEVFDLKHLVISTTEANKELLVNMFQEIGEKEFKFLIRSGAYFGFLFGVVQSAIFYAYDAWWLLPLGGFIVGFATNFLALKLIFEPVEEQQVGPFKFQGVFLKRQVEVSKEFGELSGQNFLRAEQIWGEILHGAKKKQFMQLLVRYTSHFCDEKLGVAAFPVTALIGDDGYKLFKEKVVLGIQDELPALLPYSYAYADRKLDLKTEIREKMEVLPSAEFEGVLHPVFKEDEIKLIVVGGVLGMGVGFLQLLLTEV